MGREREHRPTRTRLATLVAALALAATTLAIPALAATTTPAAADPPSGIATALSTFRIGGGQFPGTNTCYYSSCFHNVAPLGWGVPAVGPNGLGAAIVWPRGLAVGSDG